MAITRTRDVTVADVWADDDGGVTLEVGEARTSLSVEEAEAFGREVTEAARAAAEDRRLKLGELRERLSAPAAAAGVSL